MKSGYFVFFVLVLGVLVLGAANNDMRVVKAEIKGRAYTFEVADSISERMKGLMFRKELDKDGGMLFVFDQEDYLRFYMKDTFIALDVAFINEDYRVVDIKQMQPLDESAVVSSNKAKYALEVNRGFFNRAGLNIGDEVNFISDAR